jgi:two-component system response regulator FixJ
MPHEELARPTVHLIDNDLAVRDSTELLLQIAGIDVRAYASGIEFLNDISPNEIRCLVIDVNMPGIGGIDLLDRLRRSGIIAPAIFITSRGITSHLRAAVTRTGAGILLKPFRPGELIARVKDALDEN